MQRERDWTVYHKRYEAAHAQWLCALTTAEAIDFYLQLHRLAMAQCDDSPGWRRLEKERWREKVAIRRRLHQSFAALDASHGT